MPAGDKPAVYLTFDDGPHPKITPYVLGQLEQYNAKASFFCIGNNVAAFPKVYQNVIDAGHTTGNHTYSHLNGWNCARNAYVRNVAKAARLMDSRLFRPPYGRIKRSQVNALARSGYITYMWDVLSADFDPSISPQQCIDNVIRNIQPGSIVVFHDSEKAWDRMHVALPAVLKYCSDNNWELKALPRQ